MLLRLLVAALVWLGAVAPVVALDIDVSTFTLDNGLQVVVLPDRRAPVVTHMIWYRVGAADEPQGKAGIAHFLEHLMFKGTPRFPNGEFSRRVRANGGEENAFTTQDYTAYFQRIARDRLPLVMEMEADRMHNLVLTDENVLPERNVVKEERRERVDSEPGGLLAEQIDAALYTAHPYGKPVIGWMAEVDQLTRQDALDFYATHYEPANAVVIVAGDVDRQQVEALAAKYYGPLVNRRSVAERRRTPEPVPMAARRVSMADARVSSPVWQRTYLAPAARHISQREEQALSLLAEILGGGTQSRLHRRVVLDLKLAAHVGVWSTGDALDSGSFVIYAVPNPGADRVRLEVEIDAVINDLMTTGVSQLELDRARANAIASSVYVLDSQESLARIFGTALMTGQSISDIMTWEQDMQSVRPADVTAGAVKVLDINGSVTGLLLPKDAP